MEKKKKKAKATVRRWKMVQLPCNSYLDYQIILTIKVNTKSASVILPNTWMEGDPKVDVLLHVMLPWQCAVLQLSPLDCFVPPGWFSM